MNSSVENLCRLNERIQAVNDVLGNNKEYAVAGLHIKRSSYKHPKFCKMDYCVVTDVLTGETILELQSTSNVIELSTYREHKHHWHQFLKITNYYKLLGRSLKPICFG